MRLADFEVLSFGCYGTLIDRDSGIYVALRPLLESGQLRLSRQDVLAAFARHESAQQAKTPRMPYSQLLAQVHGSLAKEWGILASDDDNALFGQSVPQWPVFVDTPAALQYLKRYFRLIVLSNADRASFAGSSRRLEARFDDVVTAEEIGAYKPDPQTFETLARRVAQLGFERQRILHAGQNPVRDLIPAARCGLATAWIDRHPERPGEGAKVLSAGSVRSDFRFATLVDMVRAHQEELRS